MSEGHFEKSTIMMHLHNIALKTIATVAKADNMVNF